jgi:hypothetical protein
MINKSVGDHVSQHTQKKILNTMLDCYQDNIAQYSRFFSGINETLETIESLDLKMGHRDQ